MLKRLGWLLLAMLLLGIGFVFGSFSPRTVTAQDQFLTQYESIFADVYARVAPSVVSITVLGEAGEDLDQSFAAGGTGFVYDQQGRILTNAHVVADATEIGVYFFDGTVARAEVIGRDLDSDIAVIQVKGVPQERLFPVTLGNSDNLVVGQAVLAIGSPFGEDWTLTSGIISAVNRSIRGLSTFSTGAVIQTDAAINPGNSGGPLLNLYGEVIGVNSQIVSASRSSSGIGFAVPSTLVQRVVTELIETGKVNYSYLGISGGDISLALVEEYDIPNNLQGAVVLEVVPGAPAAQGGLRNPTQRSVDIITAINNSPIEDMDSLLAYLANNTRPNDSVVASVYRNGETMNLTIVVGSRPSNRE